MPGCELPWVRGLPQVRTVCWGGGSGDSQRLALGPPWRPGLPAGPVRRAGGASGYPEELHRGAPSVQTLMKVFIRAKRQ